MAVRNDVYVRWDLSPRLVIVEAPSTEILLQDVVDTCRVRESDIEALDDAELLTDGTSGKGDLQDGSLVGITCVFNNAQLAFETRSVTAINGTVTTAGPASPPYDGGGLGAELLTDTGADFVAASVKPGDTVINMTDFSLSAVVEVVDATNLYVLPLTGGTTDLFNLNDAYRIYVAEQCFVRGGNLIALDDVGDPLLPTFVTPNVSIQIEKSTSAALLDPDIQTGGIQ